MRKVEPKVDQYMESGPIPGRLKKGKEPEKIYPHLRLEHNFFPEAKKCEVGKKCKVMLELKTTGLSISKFQNDTEFDIVGFEMMNNNMGKKDMGSDGTDDSEEAEDDEE